MADKANYRVSLVTTKEEFNQLAFAWKSLAKRCPTSTVFNSWSWMKSWMTHYFESDHRLHVFLVWKSEILVAGFAGYTCRQGLFQVLYPVGFGEPEDCEVASEYPEVLVAAEEDERAICTLIHAHFKDWTVGFRYLYFKNMLAGSYLDSVINDLAVAKQVNKVVYGFRYFLNLPESSEIFFAGLRSKNFRYQIRKAYKTVIDDNRYSYRIAETIEEFSKFYEQMKQLHKVRWNKEGKTGAFTSEIFNQFHYNFANTCLNNDDVKIYLLCISDEGVPIALHYGFLFQNVFYFYQSGVCLDNSGLTSGVAAHALAIEDSINNSCIGYDFMKGKASSYKEKYGTQKTKMFGAFCFEGSFYKAIYKMERKITNLAIKIRN